MTLEITSFINNNPDWEEKLAGPPYFIKAKRAESFVLLKYNQISSDFTLPLVRECRGIILDEGDGYIPVCVPFFKFGNFSESYVPEIDWPSARVQEKLDGSLIKLWHHNKKWHISSNGEIDARNANVSSALLSDGQTTDLHALFMKAWDKTGISMDALDKDLNYMFELTSPHNRVVVRYDDISLHHIGARSIRTLLECDVDIGIPKPKTFPLQTLDDCIDSAKRLGYDSEGYVVVDRYFNRMKVKSPVYVALSHLIQGTTTKAHIVEILQKNEQEEFLTYFPEYSDVFNEIQYQIDLFSAKQDALFEELKAVSFDSRKSLAEVVTKTECPACLFALFDDKAPDAKIWLMSRPTYKVLEFISL